jgi:hypothetical protein
MTAPAAQATPPKSMADLPAVVAPPSADNVVDGDDGAEGGEEETPKETDDIDEDEDPCHKFAFACMPPTTIQPRPDMSSRQSFPTFNHDLRRRMTPTGAVWGCSMLSTVTDSIAHPICRHVCFW